MKIVLHIERLVLDGLVLSSVDALRLRSIVEQELGRLVDSGQSDVPRVGGAWDRRETHALRGGANGSPADIGCRIAHAVHTGLPTDGHTAGVIATPQRARQPEVRS